MDPDSPTPPPRLPLSPLLGPLDSPPPGAEVRVEFGAHSWQGPSRSVNGDHYLVLRLGRHQETLLASLPEGEVPPHFEEHGYAMVIADGAGRAGEVASRTAISTLVHLAVYFGKWNLRIDETIAKEVVDRVERFYRSVDTTLLQAGRSGPPELQTTLTAAVSAGTELFVAHVGHSRAYLFRDGELLRLTRDHTRAAEQPGRVASVDVRASAEDPHHILTDVVGMAGHEGPRVDIERCGLLDGDIVVLCTNGLTDVLDDTRIADVLKMSLSPDDQCRTLVSLAVEAGANDDVTAVTARYSVPQ